MAPSTALTQVSVGTMEWPEQDSEVPMAATVTVAPVPVPDEPNLYFLPPDLSPLYRPVPILVQAGVWLVSAIVMALVNSINTLSTTSRMSSSLSPLVSNWRRLVMWFVETALLALISTVVVQDMFWAPSRVAMSDLVQKYFLPSKLSRYQDVKLPHNTTLGVHFLECSPTSNNRSTTFNSQYDVLYLNHGFGASSLSWLPVVPVLVSRLGIAKAMGHDAPGFGFTDRTDDTFTYTTRGSAQIGLELLSRHVSSQRVLLMGHSMGSITTLRMALEMPQQHVAKDIVLVAPALGIRMAKKGNYQALNKRSLRSRCGRMARRAIDIPASYLLRRAVGTQGFWRSGLRLAWGDPNRVRDSDVLRFQWPSIGLGWEQGILDFARAQSLPTDLSDRELLEKVLKLPNTRVSVVVGTKDRVVPLAQVRSFFQDFPSVRIIELEGQGHDPFEENVELFVGTVERLLY